MKAKKLQSRTVEKEQRKLHVPTIERNYGEPPPFVVVVHGPPQVWEVRVFRNCGELREVCDIVIVM